MSEPARQAQFGIRDFTALEEYGNVKHEFLDGEIRATGGGTREHGAIAANVIALLAGALRGRPCQVHTSDVRIRVPATGLDTYPDASVVCGRALHDAEDSLAIVNPILLLEVTSPSSEAYDRGDKLEHYKRIPSLRVVLIASHRRSHVELWLRADERPWSKESFDAGEDVIVPEFGCALPVDEIYRDPLAAPY
jgi:Uma2 family endonuclease